MMTLTLDVYVSLDGVVIIARFGNKERGMLHHHLEYQGDECWECCNSMVRTARIVLGRFIIRGGGYHGSFDQR